MNMEQALPNQLSRSTSVSTRSSLPSLESGSSSDMPCGHLWETESEDPSPKDERESEL